MHVVGLKIAGFKSFVDPVEVPIEAGLTGVVGPNGCGKSNLLEALRWAMGASSARAMRGGEMDDLIFAGTSERPAREIAEVALMLDNASRSAPAEFNDLDMIEIRRSLRRGAGSTYRINDRIVRARDVQILFADASTGANSPALVRQGQISELIASKPENRRRILEEAAGIGGLAARRHEAELKLKAAEDNLSRLAELMAEVERQAGALRRQAGKARRYRDLSRSIEGLEIRLAAARWRAAADEAAESLRALEGARLAEADAVAGLARATSEEAHRRETIEPLRADETRYAGELGAANLALARLESDRAAALDGLARAEADIARLTTEQGRDQAAREEALQRSARAETELAALPAHDPKAQAAQDAKLELHLKQVQSDLTRAEGELAEVRVANARAEAIAEASTDALKRARDRLQRLEADLAQAPRLLADLGDEARAASNVEKARMRETDYRKAADDAQAALAAANKAVDAARAEELRLTPPLRDAERRVRELEAELQGLERLLLRPARPTSPPVMDSINAAGLERALAAALDSDLEASTDADAPVHWSDKHTRDLARLPEGAVPLSDQVDAPPELSARLSQCGLVAREDGDRLQPLLAQGQRLVSRDGDLWRWDGFVRRAEAPLPTAEKLAQRARRASGMTELATARAELSNALAAKEKASAKLTAAELEVMDRRRKAPEALRAASGAREAVLKAEQEQELLALRVTTMRENIRRLQDEQAQAKAAESLAREAVASRPSPADHKRAGELEAKVKASREEERTAQATLEEHRRTVRQTDLSRGSLTRERDEWRARAEAAGVRLKAAETALLAACERRDAVAARPDALKAEIDAMATRVAQAETARKGATDALALAETRLRRSETEVRASRESAAAAREGSVRADARLEAANRREIEVRHGVQGAFNLSLEALEARAAALADPASDATAEPSDASAASDADTLEPRLARLRRERDQLGAVNMEADEQLAEMAGRIDAQAGEREDLVAAIAKLREAVNALNQEGRARLLEAYEAVSSHFRGLFQALFMGGEAELRLTESTDPLDAGLEIYASPPGKRLAALSLMSGGEQALTAAALIFAVFLSRPAPICVLDEVDAPLDDANVDRFCRLLDEMRRRTETRFIVITHNPVTMSRMDRLFGVTMQERGVSRIVSVDLESAERLAAA